MDKSNPFESALTLLNKAFEILELDQAYWSIFAQPERIIQLSVPYTKDNGQLTVVKGYRVQYNNWLGPYKGGLRFHPQVDMDEVKALSFWMMIKNAVIGVPFGGGKGGLEVNPKQLSLKELESLTRAFTRLLAPNIGPEVDVPAPDVNTNGQIMAWLMDEYGKTTGHPSQAVVTGKPLDQGGSEGREEATGLGGFYILEELAGRLSLKKPQTIAIQGFGNVGYFLASLASKNGYLVVAISDSKGGIYDKAGLDIEKIKQAKSDGKSITESNLGKVITNEELLELPVDILVPAALEGVIAEENADRIKAKIILEMANGPLSAEADEILESKNIMVVPDVLANAGGVTVSYFEWYQNIHNESWQLLDVENKLKDYMIKAFASVWEIKEEKKISLRTAAYVLALQRLLSAKTVISSPSNASSK